MNEHSNLGKEIFRSIELQNWIKLNIITQYNEGATKIINNCRESLFYAVDIISNSDVTILFCLPENMTLDCMLKTLVIHKFNLLCN